MSRDDPIAHSDLTYPADPGCREQSRAWMFYELTYLRREAQAEASLAYEAWHRLPGRDGYAVYRAVQDRADAAQDELATWVRNHRRSGIRARIALNGRWPPAVLADGGAAATRADSH